MRGRISLIGVGLLMLTGCGDAATAKLPAPAVSVVKPPAEAAGGACRLLDFPVIEEVTGARFDISAASKHRKTQTCVVQAEGASRPDLALSVTPTSADAAVFADEMVPRGARSVKGLGRAAYRLTLAPGKGRGAGVEVGWLSRDGRIVCLRYTFPTGQDKAAADEFAPRLVELAEKIDAIKA